MNKRFYTVIWKQLMSDGHRHQELPGTHLTPIVVLDADRWCNAKDLQDEILRVFRDEISRVRSGFIEYTIISINRL
jgi:hypothetical protein